MSDPKTPAAIYVPPANIPPPKPLVFDGNVANGWKSWKKAWNRFEIATGVYKQDGVVRVLTLLSIIGEDGVKTFDTLSWGEDDSKENIEHVLRKFDEYCEPRTEVFDSTIENKNKVRMFHVSN